MKISLICLALFVACVVPQIQASKKQLIDDATVDLETIAQTVCETRRGNSKLIGSDTTIARLNLYFAHLSADHQLAACAAKYGQSIKQFANLLSTNNENVCSEGKLEAIEQFHRDYVSLRPKHVESRKSRQLDIPRLVKLFFMSYAAEVSSVCARDSMKQMDTLKYNSGDDQKDLPEIDSMLGRFADFFGLNQLSKGYSEVFLPWLLIDGLPLEKYSKVGAYISTSSDQKLFMKTRNPTKLVNVQTVCKDLMRPVYGRVLLPVIRLINLGYYPSDQELAKQLGQQNSPLKRLYVTTQLCESILPIKLFADPSLDTDQMILIEPKEAVGLENLQEKSAINEAQIGLSPPQNSMTNFKLNPRTSSSIDEIKANVNSRGKALSKVLKVMARTVASQLKDKVKRIFLGETKREPLVDEMSDKDVSGIDLNLDVEETEEDGLQVRMKRGLLSDIDKVLGFLVRLAIFLVLGAIVLAIAAIQLIFVGSAAMIYRLFRHLTGYAVGDIETALEVGLNLFASEEKEVDMTYKGKRTVRYIGPRKRVPQYEI